MHNVVLLEHFNSWDQLRKSDSSSKIHLPWSSTSQAAPLKQWCWALLVYSLLIKWTGCSCTHFIIFIFCVWLLMHLKWSQRLSEDLTVTLGKWKSDPEYTAVSLCVFWHFPHLHGRKEKTDVFPRFTAICPRREESHLPEGLCCCCTMTSNLYRSVHLLPVYTQSCCATLNLKNMCPVALWLSNEPCHLAQLESILNPHCCC